MSETERFEIQLWGMAPDHWLTPEDRKSHRVTSAEIVGERGSEKIVIEVERYRETTSDQSANGGKSDT